MINPLIRVSMVLSSHGPTVPSNDLRIRELSMIVDNTGTGGYPRRRGRSDMPRMYRNVPQCPTMSHIVPHCPMSGHLHRCNGVRYTGLRGRIWHNVPQCPIMSQLQKTQTRQNPTEPDGSRKMGAVEGRRSRDVGFTRLRTVDRPHAPRCPRM